MARPSLNVLQVSSGEQVEGERKNSDNSDNLMKINKNVAELDKKIIGKIIIDYVKTFADLVESFCLVQK